MTPHETSLFQDLTSNIYYSAILTKNMLLQLSSLANVAMSAKRSSMFPSHCIYKQRIQSVKYMYSIPAEIGLIIP
jgi:hypothetical protein